MWGLDYRYTYSHCKIILVIPLCRLWQANDRPMNGSVLRIASSTLVNPPRKLMEATSLFLSRNVARINGNLTVNPRKI